jgi:hypothetical protein
VSGFAQLKSDISLSISSPCAVFLVSVLAIAAAAMDVRSIDDKVKQQAIDVVIHTYKLQLSRELEPKQPTYP